MVFTTLVVSIIIRRVRVVAEVAVIAVCAYHGGR